MAPPNFTEMWWSHESHTDQELEAEVSNLLSTVGAKFFISGSTLAHFADKTGADNTRGQCHKTNSEDGNEPAQHFCHLHLN